MKNFNRPTMLMILDGYGINENAEGNAIKAAKKVLNMYKIITVRIIPPCVSFA